MYLYICFSRRPIHFAFRYSSIFANPSSPNGAIIRTARLEIRFTRAIHLTDWIDAERCVDELMPLDPTETLFLRLQLALSKGQAAAAEELLSRIEEKLERGESGAPPVDKIRRLIHEVEWHCILRNYSRKLHREIFRNENIEYATEVVQTHREVIIRHNGIIYSHIGFVYISNKDFSFRCD